MYGCYTCNHGHIRDMDLYSQNANSQPFSCCEGTSQRFCNDRHFPRNGPSNNPVYGTIGNGKTIRRKTPNKSGINGLFKINV